MLTQLADGKAAPLLALQATVAAVTLSLLGDFETVFDPDNGALAVTGALLLLATYAASSVIVLALTLAVYFPIVKRGSGSVFFFEDVRHTEWEEYRERAGTLSLEGAEDEILRQMHRASKITSD